MRKSYELFLCSICFLGLLVSQNNLYASHVAGAEIAFNCLGNGKYEVFVDYYRICNGLEINPLLEVEGNNGTSLLLSMQTHLGVKDVTYNNSACTSSKCNDPFLTYGIEKTSWKNVLDLSVYPDCEWKISTGSCCRGSNITTGMADWGYYTDVTLNSCITPCFSSPRFVQEITGKMLNLCHNKDFILYNDAIDTVNITDSISYALAPARALDSQVVQYNGQFSPQRPMRFLGFPNQNLAWPGGFHLDATTGILKFRPTESNQVGVIVIEVQRWRKINGVSILIGTTQRDFQYTVINCPVSSNSLPVLTPSISKEICANRTICVDIETYDSNATDTVRMLWDKGIPGATFIHNSGTAKHPAGQLCWTPVDSHARSQPYVAVVIAMDNSCSFNGRTVNSYSFTVKPSPIAILYHKLLGCNEVILGYTATSAGVPSHWKVRNSSGHLVWSDSAISDTLQLPPGKYTSHLSIGFDTICGNNYSDTFTIPELLKVDLPTDLIQCVNTPYQIVPSIKYGKGNVSYNWHLLNDSNTITPFSNDSFVNVSPINTSSYMLLVSDDSACVSSDTFNISVLTVHPFAGNDKEVCSGDTAKLIADSGDTYKWFGLIGFSLNPLPTPLSVTSTFNPVITEDREFIVVGYKNSDNGVCEGYDTVKTIAITSSPKANPDTSFYCEGTQASLFADSSDSYKWFNLNGFTLNPLPTPLSTTASFSPIINQNTDYILLGYKNIQGGSCLGFDTVRVNVYSLPPKPVTSFENNLLSCNSDSVSFQWYRNDTLINGANTQNYHVKLPGIYKVMVANSHGCFNFSDPFLAVPVVLKVALPEDAEICANTSFHIISMIYDAKGQVEYNWYLIDGTIPPVSFSQNSSVNVNPAVSSKYALVVSDDSGYTASDTFEINVITPKPWAGPDISVCQGDTAHLSANFCDSYQWFDLNGFTLNPLPIPLSEASTFNPIVAESKEYIVVGYKNLPNMVCSGMDTVIVNMDSIPDKPLVHLTVNKLICKTPAISYQWFLNDTLLPGATLSTFDFWKSGSYKVRVENGAGCFNFSDTVSAIPTRMGIRVYPNPSKGEFFVAFYIPEPQTFSFIVYDAAGREVYSQQIFFDEGSHEYPIMLSGLSSGVYYLVISNETIRMPWLLFNE